MPSYQTAAALAHRLGFDPDQAHVYLSDWEGGQDFYFAQEGPRGAFALRFSSWQDGPELIEDGELRRIASTELDDVADPFEPGCVREPEPYLSVDAQGRLTSTYGKECAGSFQQIAYGKEEHILDLPDRRRVCVNPQRQTCQTLSDRPIIDRPLAEWLASQPPALAAQFQFWLENPPRIGILGAEDAAVVRATETFLAAGDTGSFPEHLRLGTAAGALQCAPAPSPNTVPQRGSRVVD